MGTGAAETNEEGDGSAAAIVEAAWKAEGDHMEDRSLGPSTPNLFSCLSSILLMAETKVPGAAVNSVSSSPDGPVAVNSEVVTYTAPWPVYALGFPYQSSPTLRLALGSFIESRNNRVEVLELEESSHHFQVLDSFEHTYPASKLMWLPDTTGSKSDLLASSSDCLRLFRFQPGGSKPVSQLLNRRNAKYSSPLTSFDWNVDNTSLIGTASIDTTCTIWDIEKETVTTQLIAHDKEVHDIAFAKGVHVFASVGADGSVRLFDLRSLEHSTILYESCNFTPLLRLAWNKVDENYLATIMMDSHTVTILDVRAPAIPLAELLGHRGAVNALTWAPHSCCHICTAGDDTMALIWDLQRPAHSMQGTLQADPILTYTAEAEICNLQWSPAASDWVAIAFNSSVQALRT